MVSADVNSAGAHFDPTRTPRRLMGLRTLAAIFLYFLIAGIATVMLGPALPLLAARWDLPDAQLGTFFAVYFGGQFCGSWLGSQRLGTSLLLGSAATAFGFAVLAYAGPIGGHFALLCIGLGLGAGMTAGNVMVGTLGEAEVAAEGGGARGGSSSARLLALLNVSWGVGAIACPLVLDASLRAGYLHARPGRLFFLGLVLAFTVCAALVALLLPRTLYGTARLTGTQAGPPWRLLCLFGATLVLYVGVENSLGGWLPTYAERLLPGGISGRGAAARVSSIALCFWISELAGRSLMALVIRRVREAVLYRVCLTVVIGAVGVLVATPRITTAWIFVVTAVLALSLAPLFPLGVSFLLAQTGNDSRVGRVFAVASLGGTLLPWLTGIASSQLQSLRLGFVVPAVGAMLMLALSRYLPDSSSAAISADR